MPAAAELGSQGSDSGKWADSEKWAVLAARTAEDKLGRGTLVIDVREAVGITDYFVITNGGNFRQVDAIVDAVAEAVSAAGGPKPHRIEGKDERKWVLMDYLDFVVHVFDPEAREYYQLERLWETEPRVDWEVGGGGEATGGGATGPAGEAGETLGSGEAGED